MATIATLAAKISADGTVFGKVIDDVNKKAATLEGTAARVGRAFTALKALGVAVAAFIGAQMAGHAIQGVIDDLHIARAVGTDIAAINELQQALRDMGQPAEKAGDVLKDLVQTLGRADFGDAAVIDAFNQIGLDAHQLSAMKPDDALRAIADKFAAMKDPGQAAAMAVRIFGDNAAAMLPVLMQGSKGLDEAREKAEGFGQGVRNIDAANLETLSNMMQDLAKAAKAVAARIAVELLPFIMALVQEMQSLAHTGVSVTDVIKGVVYVLAFLFAIIREALNVLDTTFKFIKLGFLSLVRVFGWGLTKIAEMAAKLPKKFGGQMFKGLANEFRGTVGEIDKDIKKTTNGINANIDEMGSHVAGVDKWFQRLSDSAAELGKKAEQKRNPPGLTQITKYAAQLSEANDVVRETQTPLEKFQSRITQLDKLLGKAIGPQTYARAVAKAVQELEEAHQLSNLAMPEALKANTVEAQSAINKANMQEQRRFRESPQDRVRRVLEQSQEIEKEQLKQQTKIAEGVQQQRVVRF